MDSFDYNGMRELIEQIKYNTGYDFSGYKEKPFKRRIRVMLRTYKLKSVGQLIRYLEKNRDDYQNLIRIITINVTEFFRNSEVFDQFTYILNKNITEGHEYKVLSAGCATGEEPYSIAFIFEKLTEKYHIKYSIDGIDIDRGAITKAKNGEYPIEELESIPYDFRQFVNIGKSTLEIKKQIKTHIRFMLKNIYEGENNSPEIYDFIFCRNVFIYFGKDLQLKILDNFHQILNKNGYLILGKVETLPLNFKNKFEMIDLRNRIYKKL